MKIRNYFKALFVLVGLFLSLGAFPQAKNGSDPQGKCSARRCYIKVNGKIKWFTPSADGAEVEVSGKTYFVEGVREPFDINEVEGSNVPDGHNAEPSTPNAPTQSTERQELRKKENANPGRGSAKLEMIDDVEGLNGQMCNAKSKEADMASLYRYIQYSTQQELARQGLALKDYLPTPTASKLDAGKKIIEDFLNYKYHSSTNTLSDFSSVLGKPKISPEKILKRGIEVTQDGIFINLGTDDLEQDVTLRFDGAQIGTSSFLAPRCSFQETISSGIKDAQYLFADKCGDFDINQGEEIKYRIFLNNKNILQESILITGR